MSSGSKSLNSNIYVDEEPGAGQKKKKYKKVPKKPDLEDLPHLKKKPESDSESEDTFDGV